MIRLIAIAAFALAAATSAQAMSPAPLHQADGMITQVRQAIAARGCSWNERTRSLRDDIRPPPCPPRSGHRQLTKLRSPTGALCLVGLFLCEMDKFVAFADFALALATSAQAMPRVPLHQPDGMLRA